MAAEESMKEIVRRLRAEHGEALLELLEFGYAFEELLKNLEGLAAASDELHTATCNIVGSEEQEGSRQDAVRELASRLNAGVAQFLSAFQQMHGAVRGWNITDIRGDSNLPSSGKRMVPRD